MASPAVRKRTREPSPPIARHLDASRSWKLYDCMDIEPHALVNSRVKVFWDGEQRFYAGTICSLEADTWMHTVQYDDGDVRKELLCLEKVQLPRLGPKEAPWPAPSPQQLLQLGDALSRLAEREAGGNAAQTGARAARQRGTNNSAKVKRLEHLAMTAMTRAVQLQEGSSQHAAGGQDRRVVCASTSACPGAAARPLPASLSLGCLAKSPCPGPEAAKGCGRKQQQLQHQGGLQQVEQQQQRQQTVDGPTEPAQGAGKGRQALAPDQHRGSALGQGTQEGKRRRTKGDTVELSRLRLCPGLAHQPTGGSAKARPTGAQAAQGPRRWTRPSPASEAVPGGTGQEHAGGEHGLGPAAAVVGHLLDGEQDGPSSGPNGLPPGGAVPPAAVAQDPADDVQQEVLAPSLQPGDVDVGLSINAVPTPAPAPVASPRPREAEGRGCNGVQIQSHVPDAATPEGSTHADGQPVRQTAAVPHVGVAATAPPAVIIDRRIGPSAVVTVPLASPSAVLPCSALVPPRAAVAPHALGAATVPQAPVTEVAQEPPPAPAAPQAPAPSHAADPPISAATLLPHQLPPKPHRGSGSSLHPRPLAATGRTTKDVKEHAVQYTEVDVALSMEPQSLLGLPLKVFWPLDRQFYPGRAVSYDPVSCKHRIVYKDGDEEERVLAVDKVMLGLQAAQGQKLAQGTWPRPSVQQLRAVAVAVESEATAMQAQGANRRQVDTVRQRASAIAAVADGMEKAEEEQRQAQGHCADDEHDCHPGSQPHLARPRPPPALPVWRVAPAGSNLQLVLQPQEAESLGSTLVSAYQQFNGAKGQYAQFRELDLAYRLSPKALVGRQLRVYWVDDDAWFLGTVVEWNETTGQHVVDYADGDREVLFLAVESVRLLVHAGEEVPMASSGAIRDMAGKMEREGQRLLGGAAGLGGGDAMQVDGVGKDDRAAGERLLAKAVLMRARAEVRQQEEARQAAAMGAEAMARPSEAAGMVAAAATAQQQATGSVKSTEQLQQDAQRAHDEGALPPKAAPEAGAGAEASGGNAVPPALPPPSPAAGPEQLESQPQQAGLPVDVPLVPLAPGDPAWAYLKGHTPWPCILITKEEAARLGVDGAASASTSTRRRYVTFFGDAASASVPASGVLPFVAGVQRGLHNPRLPVVAKRRIAYFRSALLEVLSYLREGDLPRAMVPDNKDEGFASDSDSDSDADPNERGSSRGPASGPSAGTKALAEASIALPAKLSKNLWLNCLGRIEWLNPKFHTEQFIYPIGFRATRLCSTPASGKAEAEHVFEVATTADGLRPLFKVTPQGGKTVEGVTPTQAYTALWDSDPASRAKSLQRTGHEAFGFTHRRIAALIRSIPGANRCDGYRGWPEGVPPGGAPGLAPEEQLARTAILASMQHLPPGIAPQPGCRPVPWECDVCGEQEETEGSLFLHCDGCQLTCHMDCIGEERPPDGSLWLCDLCRLRQAGLQGPGPPCALCPVQGGPMKRTTDGRWCHLLCAMWVPEVGFADPDRREPIECVDKVTQARKQLSCRFCRQPYGAPIQCAGGRTCFTAFHPMCARNAGLAMVLEAAEDVDSGSGSERETERKQRGSAGQVAAGETGTASGSGLQAAGCQAEPGAAAGQGLAPGRQVLGQLPPPGQLPEDPGAQKQAGKAAAVRVPKRKSRHRASAWEEGTRAGSHRLLCFCAKHTSLAGAGLDRRRIYTALQEEQQQQPQQPQPQQQQGPAARGQGAPAQQLAGSSRQASIADDAGDRASGGAVPCSKQPGATMGACPKSVRQPSPPSAPQKVVSHNFSSARCVPLASRRSRGPREPDTLALAESKRLYVQRTPYLVTSCLRRSMVLELRQQAPQQPGQHQVSALLGEQAGPARQTVASGAGKADGKERQGTQAGRPSAGVSTSAAAPAVHSGCSSTGAGSAGPPGPALPRSMAERYQEMKTTLGKRLTCGKSAIHGLGAIAKTFHRAGDMVTEYVGELIRPSVADVRERASYNQLVGSGTYVFRLNEDACVDATRAGNMAHLLNHSCEPNCISRTITVRNGRGVPEDHVVIFAKRDLLPGCELTYDYRFNGEELLPCNCGAPACRGFVNVPGEMGEDKLVVPRSALLPISK